MQMQLIAGVGCAYVVPIGNQCSRAVKMGPACSQKLCIIVSDVHLARMTAKANMNQGLIEYTQKRESRCNRCLIAPPKMAPAAMSLTDNKCFYATLTKIKRERVEDLTPVSAVIS
ncbi:hypothetical protein Zmor_023028 [Zophobas morio]|uniref:Uncharacterized protein n=1 Tax=Zophobas morio TaxID=2755281 RepID=A0AA38HY93_9CUCU|nr:hypothetical protein Zmor_023028 [Zophobas morio]